MSPLLLAGWAAVLLGCLRPIGSHDLFWHLTAGELILKEGRVPRADWLTGAPWTDFEWLAQLVYALVHRLAGLPGLIALKTLLLLGAAWCVDAIMARRNAEPARRGAALAALAACWTLGADVRPENFTLLLLAFLLLRLETGLKPWAAAALFAFWANLHAGFVLGLFALAAHQRWKLLAAAAAGSLLNPFGPMLYSVVLEHARDGAELSRWLIEWRRPDLRNAATWPFWALLAWLAARARRLKRAELLLAAGLAFAALSHQRASIPLALAVAYAPPPPWAAVAGLWTLRPAPWNGALLRGAFPEKTAEFLSRRPDLAGLKLYNPWGWGGYLYWRAPGLRLLWDGRYIFHGLLPEERAATESPAAWKAFLDRRGLDLVLLERAQPDIQGRPYWTFFMPSAQWELLAEDEASLLFKRKRPR